MNPSKHTALAGRAERQQPAHTPAQPAGARASRPPLAPDDPRSRPATRRRSRQRPAAEGPPDASPDQGKT